MATPNQNSTSNTNSRPMKNDSQIGGRKASTDKSWEEKTDEGGSYKSDIDSRRTISPSTSDDVSSKGASSTDVHEAPERKTQPDFDQTQDPKINVYGSTQPKSPRVEEPEDYEADVNAANADLDLQADKQSEGSKFNKKDNDLDFNTTSTRNPSRKDNLQH